MKCMEKKVRAYKKGGQPAVPKPQIPRFAGIPLHDYGPRLSDLRGSPLAQTARARCFTVFGWLPLQHVAASFRDHSFSVPVSSSAGAAKALSTGVPGAVSFRYLRVHICSSC